MWLVSTFLLVIIIPSIDKALCSFKTPSGHFLIGLLENLEKALVGFVLPSQQRFWKLRDWFLVL